MLLHNATNAVHLSMCTPIVQTMPAICFLYNAMPVKKRWTTAAQPTAKPYMPYHTKRKKHYVKDKVIATTFLKKEEQTTCPIKKI
jgi:hypothetical protein